MLSKITVIMCKLISNKKKSTTTTKKQKIINTLIYVYAIGRQKRRNKKEL